MNAIVKHESINEEREGLIKRMIAKDATSDELQLFLHQCERTGLDPFSKQIYAISRWSKEAQRKVMAIQVSIDGARLIAERTGKYDNQEGPYWCGEDGMWKDVWLSNKPPCAAKVLVFKVGSSRATTGIAHWNEYRDDKSSFWQSKPALMLAKCAEMLALRKAFPQELSGLYTQEEMGQADNVVDVTPRVAVADTGEIVDGPPVATDEIFESDNSPLAAKRKEFNALGEELYGEQWPMVSKRNAARITGGVTRDPDALTAEQLQMLIRGMETIKGRRDGTPQPQVA